MNAAEQQLRCAIPVYVNSFNMPTYVNRLVQSLYRSGFRNIVVIDQASTNPIVVDLLKELELKKIARVVRMKHNRGPRYFFDSLRYKFAGRYYIYTDPDIELPNPLPVNFVSELVRLSDAYRIGKVGCALDLSDSHLFDQVSIRQEGQATATTIVQHESQFWVNSCGNGLYTADVDTTFALYNARWFKLWHFMKAIRVAGDFTVKHRPWYVDKRMPAAELAFYKDSTKFSSWFNNDNTGATLFRETPARFAINRVKAARWAYWKWKEARRAAPDTFSVKPELPVSLRVETLMVTAEPAREDNFSQ